MFFKGSYGDVVWDRLHQNLAEPRGDTDASLCEFRLIEGVFLMVVPWWGIRKVKDIQKKELEGIKNRVGVVEEQAAWNENDVRNLKP